MLRSCNYALQKVKLALLVLRDFLVLYFPRMTDNRGTGNTSRRTSSSLLGRLEAMDWPRCLDYSNGGFGPLLSLSTDQK